MLQRQRVWPLLMLCLLPLLAACARAEDDAAPAVASTPAPAPTDEVYRYNQLLVRDAILPVYAPEFVTADEATMADEQLVLGVAIDGAAKAYPISVLNSREMVNDELAGIPILATW